MGYRITQLVIHVTSQKEKNMPILSIKRSMLSEQIFHQLKDSIVCGEWLPGDKLPSEHELCQLFHVSRVPIREALRKLCAIGVLETRRGEGTYVSFLTAGSFMNSLLPVLILNPKNMMDILQYRSMVEGESAALAAQNATDDDLRNMQECVETITQIARPCLEFSQADLRFHRVVAEATQNSLIKGIAVVIQDILLGYYRKINEVMGTERAVYYHTLIYEAICDRDAETARRWMNEHVQTTVEDMAKEFVITDYSETIAKKGDIQDENDESGSKV